MMVTKGGAIFRIAFFLAYTPLLIKSQCEHTFGSGSHTIELKDYAEGLLTGCKFIFPNGNRMERSLKVRQIENIPNFLVNISGGWNETMDIFNGTTLPTVQVIQHKPIRIFVQANLNLVPEAEPYIRYISRSVPWVHKVDRLSPMTRGAVIFAAYNNIEVGAPCGLQAIWDGSGISIRHVWTEHRVRRLRCQWRIENPNNTLLKFQLAHLSNPPESAYLLSLEDPSTREMIMNFEWPRNSMIAVYNRVLRLRLVVIGAGANDFQFAMNVTGVPCGLRLNRPSGNITWFPTDQWHLSRSCRWSIEVPEEKHIVLNFDVFQVHTASNWSLNISTLSPKRSEIFEASPSVSHRIVPSNKVQFELKMSSWASENLHFEIRYSALDSSNSLLFMDYYLEGIITMLSSSTTTLSPNVSTESPILPGFIYYHVSSVYTLASPCGSHLPEELNYLRVWHQWTIHRTDELECRWRVYNTDQRDIQFRMEKFQGANITLKLLSPSGAPLIQYDNVTNLNVVYTTTLEELMLDLLIYPNASVWQEFLMAFM